MTIVPPLCCPWCGSFRVGPMDDDWKYMEYIDGKDSDDRTIKVCIFKAKCERCDRSFVLSYPFNSDGVTDWKFISEQIMDQWRRK